MEWNKSSLFFYYNSFTDIIIHYAARGYARMDMKEFCAVNANVMKKNASFDCLVVYVLDVALYLFGLSLFFWRCSFS